MGISKPTERENILPSGLLYEINISGKYGKKRFV